MKRVVLAAQSFFFSKDKPPVSGTTQKQTLQTFEWTVMVK
ncbi:hypothetical protein MNBD_GAMMA12-2674 [hydrothermal vent metagenome]|uniref:Uncharacterized protein n=1 Tax=hydrothermal vent metagenome TaxID=652676 RepID=A0A3B0YKE0_9ZZZZ